MPRNSHRTKFRISSKYRKRFGYHLVSLIKKFVFKIRWIFFRFLFFSNPITKELTLLSDLLDMNMYDYIKNRKRCLSEVKVKKFLFQLLCGLHHLHRHGVFHRDIKPENILIKVNNRLIDNPLMVSNVSSCDHNILGAASSSTLINVAYPILGYS